MLQNHIFVVHWSRMIFGKIFHCENRRFFWSILDGIFKKLSSNSDIRCDFSIWSASCSNENLYIFLSLIMVNRGLQLKIGYFYRKYPMLLYSESHFWKLCRRTRIRIDLTNSVILRHSGNIFSSAHLFLRALVSNLRWETTQKVKKFPNVFFFTLWKEAFTFGKTNYFCDLKAFE